MCAPRGAWFYPRDATPKLRSAGVVGHSAGGLYRYLKEHGYADSRYSSIAVEYRLLAKAYAENIPSRTEKYRRARAAELMRGIQWCDKEIERYSIEKSKLKAELIELTTGE